jgi:hypothetical protein
MSAELTNRPQWAIDHELDGLIGVDVRVAAKAFSPTRWTGDALPRVLPVRTLFLPDNSQPAGLPVFFEGRLCHYQRRIGVVFVCLDCPASPDSATEGPTCFRGTIAVLLRGPAVVELAFPFQVERLPADPDNYWRDVRFPRAQFEFPFSAETEGGCNDSNAALADSPTGIHPVDPTPGQCPRSPERRLPPVDLLPPGAVDRSHGTNAVEGEPCRSLPGPNATLIRNLNYSPLTH